MRRPRAQLEQFLDDPPRDAFSLNFHDGPILSTTGGLDCNVQAFMPKESTASKFLGFAARSRSAISNLSLSRAVNKEYHLSDQQHQASNVASSSSTTFIRGRLTRSSKNQLHNFVILKFRKPQASLLRPKIKDSEESNLNRGTSPLFCPNFFERANKKRRRFVNISHSDSWLETMGRSRSRSRSREVALTLCVA